MPSSSKQRNRLGWLLAVACLWQAPFAWSVPEKDEPGEPAELPAAVNTEDATLWCQLERLVPGQLFDSPVALVPIPGTDGEVVIVQQRGKFSAIKLRVEGAEPRSFLDFQKRMEGLILFEEGVHGLAFHPKFEENGLFYLSYSQNNPRRTVISEMRATRTKVPEALPETERVIMTVPQPLADHWGGQLVFGPDEMLYIALGDGGLRDDTYRMAQNPWCLHGKILRIDVDHRQPSLAYAIPKDNPFVGRQVFLEEIYALGFRNPWGLHFDPANGELWCADVGQDLWEEVNRVIPGGNYGWSDRDGPQGLAAHPDPLLPDAQPIDPVYAYTRLRAEGICIIGGVLYRGDKLPTLSGSYVYADWGYGYVVALDVDPSTQKPRQRLMLHRRAETGEAFNPTAVTVDGEGEIVVLSQEGAIWGLTNR